jgi:hypothetical protein
VYPGDKDKGHCYYVSREKKENCSLSEIIENLEGVGFIGLNPIVNDRIKI